MALVLYTLGGDTNTPRPFVNFLRAYCGELFVLVPFWAHSAGTLIALGADRIYMTRFGTLSPVDPSVTNEFNPDDPASSGERIPIAVEDVLAFFQLASEQGGNDADAFRQLAESVHPLAIGNVKRNIEQIRKLATKLIGLHTPDLDDAELTALVTRFDRAVLALAPVQPHGSEALGLPVEPPPEEVEDRLLAYYDELKSDLELLEKFDPGATAEPDAVLERGYIETPTTCDAFVTRGAGERWETIA